jgi:hypothetical protein
LLTLGVLLCRMVGFMSATCSRKLGSEGLARGVIRPAALVGRIRRVPVGPGRGTSLVLCRATFGDPFDDPRRIKRTVPVGPGPKLLFKAFEATMM